MTRGIYLTRAEQLEIGKRIHEKEWSTMRLASIALKRSVTNLRKLLNMYRESIGVRVSLSEGMRQMHQAKKREAQEASTNLIPSPSLFDITKYERRIADLEAELRHAHEHCDTLQKLLMRVGTTL